MAGSLLRRAFGETEPLYCVRRRRRVVDVHFLRVETEATIQCVVARGGKEPFVWLSDRAEGIDRQSVF